MIKRFENFENDKNNENMTYHDSSNGWDKEALNNDFGIMDILSAFSKVDYELNNSVRGSYTGAENVEDLGKFLLELANDLKGSLDAFNDEEEDY